MKIQFPPKKPNPLKKYQNLNNEAFGRYLIIFLMENSNGNSHEKIMRLVTSKSS